MLAYALSVFSLAQKQSYTAFIHRTVAEGPDVTRVIVLAFEFLDETVL